MGEINTNQPIQRLREEKWNEIINLSEEELRQTLGNKQQGLCHLVINELADRIGPNSQSKPLKEIVSKIVHCLPDYAADYHFSLATILNYMRTNDIFNVQPTGWLNVKAWTRETIPDPLLAEKIKINIEKGDGKFALALLKHGFSVSNEELGELLLSASSKGKRVLVDLIIQKIHKNIQNIDQSDLTAIKDYCEDALFEASSRGETDIVKELVDFGNKLNQYLVKKSEHFDINFKDIKGNTSLHLAIMSGHTETAKILIELKADVNPKNSKGQTPLHLATLEANQEISLMLILNRAITHIEDKKGRKPNLDILTGVLEESILKGNTVLALALIRSGVPIKNDFLFLACKLNNSKVAAQLIEKKESHLIHFKDKQGNTPLHWTCLNENSPLTTSLIQNGADFLIANKHGDTPMKNAPFEQSFFVKHAIAYIKSLDLNFGKRIEIELSRPIPLSASDSAKTLFALTALLKGLENTKGIDLRKFIKDDIIYNYFTSLLWSYEGEKYFKRLEEAVSHGLLTLATGIGGNEFQQDFTTYYASALSGLKSVFDNPFLTASSEEKMRMVFLAKAQKICTPLISNLKNKGYPEEVVESAILRYMNACQAKKIPSKLPTEEIIFPFCFEAVIENALRFLPTERKEAIIALFNTMKGKDVPLTKEGQKRLAFMASKAASPNFAGGRSPDHFRVLNKLPAILRAMHISDVNGLNSFINDELLGEMFDKLLSDIFKNINANELLEATIDNPEEALLLILTPVISSLIGGEKLDEETTEIIQEIAEGISGALSNQMQILKRDDVNALTRPLEFTIGASTEMLFKGLMEGIEDAWKAEKEKPSEEPSLTQQLVRTAAEYLFSQPTGVLAGRGASFGVDIVKSFISREWLVKGVLSLVIQGLNQAIPYIINKKVKEYEEQGLELQYDLFNSLSAVSPQLTILVGKILTNLTSNFDLDKAHNLITQWQNYKVEASIDKRLNKEEATKAAKMHIVNMLYESIITVIKEVQKDTPDLFDGVISGIKEISSQGLRMSAIEKDFQIPFISLPEEKPREKLTLEQTQIVQKITKDLETELTRLSTSGLILKATIPEKEFKEIQQLLPEFEKEFEGLFLNKPQISELVGLLRRGSVLLKNGYTAKEIAMGCRKYWEALIRDNLSLTSPAVSEQLYPFVFDAVIEIMADDAIHSGKTRLQETKLLKEKLRFYFNHTTINSRETPLNENGKAVLKAIINTLLDPEFCKGLPLLHPLFLERFPLILQGAKLSNVDRLNSKKSELIRKILIDESEVCLKKINIGNIKNGMLNSPQEFMMRIADPLVNILTLGLTSEIKQENERVVHEMINAFVLTSPIQNLLSDAKKLLEDYNLHGIELDVDFSLEGLENELKKTIGELLSTLSRGQLPSSESAKSMVLTQVLLALAQQFAEAQSLRTELAQYQSTLRQAERAVENLEFKISLREEDARDTKKTEAERENAKQKIDKLTAKMHIKELELQALEIRINPLIAEKKKAIASNKIAAELQQLSGIKATGISWGITFGKVLDPSNTKMLETILTWGKPWISPFILSPVEKIINESTAKRKINNALVQDLGRLPKNKSILIPFIQKNLGKLPKEELEKLTPDELINLAQKELNELIQEDSDKLLIAETIKANESKIVNLLFNIILANLPLLNNVSKLMDLVNYMAYLSNYPLEKVDQVKMMQLYVESIDVILDNIVIFQDVIPTLFDSLRRVQALDLKPQWIEEPPKEKEDLLQVKGEKAAIIERTFPKGITNIGNSCFLNSTMQVLIQNPIFREKIMDAGWVGFVKFKNEVKEQAFNKKYYKLCSELDYFDWDNLDDVNWENLGREDIKLNEEQQRFMQDKAKEYSQAKKLQLAVQNFVLALDASQRPKDMGDAAAKLRQAIYDTGVFGWERLNEEQDSSVLLELLMLWIGVANPFEITRTFSLVNEEIKESYPVGILQVPIQEGMDVQNLLQDLFNTKNVNDPENAINIKGTYQSQWNETVRIGAEPPQQIPLQFKRFRNDGTKIRDRLNLPHDHILDLSLGFERNEAALPARYKVTGAIQHVGDSIAKGHYVAFTLKDEQWYRTSDDDVTLVNATDIDRMLAYSYILFLEKEQ